jgi:3-carboxy-cis,cis-muconate cycloisomerase
VLTRACVREAQVSIDLLLGSMGQEHERAAGAWHAEWQALTGALAFTGGAVSWLHDVLANLEVYPDRMRANLDATHGLVMAERVTLLLSEQLGRDAAHALIRSASGRVGEDGGTLRDALLADEEVRHHLSVGDIERVLDPVTYLGSAEAFIDRALAMHRRREKVGSS